MLHTIYTPHIKHNHNPTYTIHNTHTIHIHTHTIPLTSIGRRVQSQTVDLYKLEFRQYGTTGAGARARAGVRVISITVNSSVRIWVRSSALDGVRARVSVSVSSSNLCFAVECVNAAQYSGSLACT